jgi:hypothetical protein
MSACADCVKGSLDEGTPRGQDSSIAGVPCYITQPPADTANSCAVILATDIFGYQLINARLIADAYADAGYICVIPDYFEGEPMNMKLLEAFESLPTQNFLGKIAAGLQLALQVVNLVSSWYLLRGKASKQDRVGGVKGEGCGASRGSDPFTLRA